MSQVFDIQYIIPNRAQKVFALQIRQHIGSLQDHMGRQLNEIFVAMWMMNVYTFYSKSIAQKTNFFS